jgi:hypothetical protein
MYKTGIWQEHYSKTALSEAHDSWGCLYHVHVHVRVFRKCTVVASKFSAVCIHALELKGSIESII